jgi:hypothetical protein
LSGQYESWQIKEGEQEIGRKLSNGKDILSACDIPVEEHVRSDRWQQMTDKIDHKVFELQSAP